MGYSPWGHKESDTAEPVIALHNISMHGVKTSMCLVQQSCEAVVLLSEERQTCVLQGGHPLPFHEQQVLWSQQEPCYANSPEGCSVLFLGKGAQRWQLSLTSQPKLSLENRGCVHQQDFPFIPGNVCPGRYGCKAVKTWFFFFSRTSSNSIYPNNTLLSQLPCQQIDCLPILSPCQEGVLLSKNYDTQLYFTYKLLWALGRGGEANDNLRAVIRAKSPSPRVLTEWNIWAWKKDNKPSLQGKKNPACNQTERKDTDKTSCKPSRKQCFCQGPGISDAIATWSDYCSSNKAAPDGFVSIPSSLT